jgi:hypothetical protein
MSIMKRAEITTPGEQRAVTANKALFTQNKELRRITQQLINENDRLKWVAKWRFRAMTIEAAALVITAIIIVMA